MKMKIITPVHKEVLIEFEAEDEKIAMMIPATIHDTMKNSRLFKKSGNSYNPMRNAPSKMKLIEPNGSGQLCDALSTIVHSK